MGPLEAPMQELGALDDGRAFADLSTFRKVRVVGAGARAWLNDLVTCDVATIASGNSRRSLLLSPTGRVLADFAVAEDEEGFILLQAPEQSPPVGSLLARYVLSSEVSVRDGSNERWLLAVPGSIREIADLPSSTVVLTPSVLGAGVDLLISDADASSRARQTLVRHGFTQASPESLEVWRIRRGVPRMGADFGADALPAEAGLEEAVDFTKGCFLGQEAVAKVRNLGHPSHVLRRVRSREPLGAGAPVMAGEEVAGTITSAAADRDGSTAGIARVRWRFADAELRTADGAAMVAVGSTD